LGDTADILSHNSDVMRLCLVIGQNFRPFYRHLDIAEAHQLHHMGDNIRKECAIERPFLAYFIQKRAIKDLEGEGGEDAGMFHKPHRDAGVWAIS